MKQRLFVFKSKEREECFLFSMNYVYKVEQASKQDCEEKKGMVHYIPALFKPVLLSLFDLIKGIYLTLNMLNTCLSNTILSKAKERVL